MERAGGGTSPSAEADPCAEAGIVDHRDASAATAVRPSGARPSAPGQNGVPALPWAALGAVGACARLVDLGGTHRDGLLVLVLLALGWGIALVLAAERSGGSLVVLLGGAGAASVVIATPFVGRDSLLVAVGGIVVLDALVRRSRPSLPWHRAGSGASLPALAVLVLAQVRWFRNEPLSEVVALTAAAYVLALLPLPALLEPSLSDVRRWSTAAVRSLRSVARIDVVRTAAIGGLVGLAWAPVYWRLVHDPTLRVLGINDYPLHLEVAQSFTLIPFATNAPHFLFHAVTAAWDLVLATDLAPVVTLAVTLSASYVAFVHFLRQPPRDAQRIPLGTARVVAIAYFFAETPTLLLLHTGIVPSTSPLYTVHWWGNPTWLMCVPFIFLTLPLIERVIGDAPDDRPDLRAGPILGAVTVLGALGKPGLALCLIPALPVYAVVVRRCDLVTLRRLVTWCVLPGAAVIVWQTWFLGASDASQFSSGWTIDPIVDAPFGWSNVGVEFFLPFAPVVLAIAIGGRAFFRDRSVQLVLLCSAVGIPLMLTVRETAERAVHGNLAVPAQACMTLLVAVSVRFLVQRVLAARAPAGSTADFRDEMSDETGDELRDEETAERSRRPRSRRPRFGVAVAVVGLVAAAFMAGGLLSYLDGIGVVHVPIDWLDTI